MEINQPPNIVNVRISTIREHGASAGELKLIAVISDPILHRLLNRQLLVRHVGVPREIPARRPREGIFVAVRRRHAALQELALLRAVPLPVYQPVSAESKRSVGVLARRVLAVHRVAWRVSFTGSGAGFVEAVVRVEVEFRVVVDRGDIACGGGGGVLDGDGGAAVLPDAEEVGDDAEEDDEGEEVGAFPGEGGAADGLRGFGGGVVWW